MCGIAGLFKTKKNNEEFPSSSIKEMTEIISHRGPDDEGFAYFSDESYMISGGKNTPKEVYMEEGGETLPYLPKGEAQNNSTPHFGALGHCRLSILDLSPLGHQPMCGKEKNIWITYNGEVYNYIEIKKTLEEKGHKFHTKTDTEVILKAYEEWGEKCLSRFNGMFSFVIFDRKNNKLFAARDRFGIKPLYYWFSPKGYLAFASEIKQFTTLPGWEAVMNGQRVYDFLNSGLFDHTEETLFDEVKQIRGGQSLTFSLKTEDLKVSTWYKITPKPFTGSLKEAGKKFYSLLEDSIRLRLRADVPVGSCLSGGLDSSSIVCIANKILKETNSTNKQKTFSACSKVKKYDEKHFMDIVVEACKVQAHHCYPPLDSLIDTAKKIVWHQDEPFGSTSIYAQWCVFDMVRKTQVKVMLDGQGADEYLAGYGVFYGCRIYDLLKEKKFLSLLKEAKNTEQTSLVMNSFKQLLKLFLPNFIKTPLKKAFKKSIPNSHPNPDWLNFALLQAKPQDPFQKVKQKSIIDQSLLQLQNTSLPMLLHWEDRDSMAHSIEARTPFLDYRLVEFVLGLPSEYKLKNGTTKKVLREGMKKTLPEPIRTRKDKIGFATPEEVWMKKENPELFLKLVERAIDVSQGTLLPEVKTRVNNILSGKEPFSFFIWRLISYGHWIEKFQVKTTKTRKEKIPCLTSSL